MTPEERAAKIIVECNLTTAVRHRIAAAIREAVEAEREACAIICDEEHLAAGYEPGGAKAAADRIRARGEPPCPSCGGSGWVTALCDRGVHAWAGGPCRCVGGNNWRNPKAAES